MNHLSHALPFSLFISLAITLSPFNTIYLYLFLFPIDGNHLLSSQIGYSLQVSFKPRVHPSIGLARFRPPTQYLLKHIPFQMCSPHSVLDRRSLTTHQKQQSPISVTIRRLWFIVPVRLKLHTQKKHFFLLSIC